MFHSCDRLDTCSKHRFAKYVLHKNKAIIVSMLRAETGSSKVVICVTQINESGYVSLGVWQYSYVATVLLDQIWHTAPLAVMFTCPAYSRCLRWLSLGILHISGGTSGMEPETDWDMMHITGKHTLRSLSLSYQKKDGRAWPCPFFFWYDTDF